MRERIRRVVPWVVAAGCLLYLFHRTPPRAALAALGRPSLPLFFASYLVYFGALFATGSLTTWVTLRVALRGRRIGYRQAAHLRAATYPLTLVHQAAAHGGMVYLLRDELGVPATEGAGAALLTTGAHLLALLIAGSVGTIVSGDHLGGLDPLAWAVLAGLPVYLALLALRPRRLAALPVAAPLFAAGVRGHVAVVAVQLLHVTIASLGHWTFMRQFGVAIPLAQAVARLPLLLFAIALPVSPAGLGPTQVAAVSLFARFADGATLQEREAAVFACSLAAQFLGGLLKVLFGVVAARHMARHVSSPVAPETD